LSIDKKLSKYKMTSDQYRQDTEIRNCPNKRPELVFNAISNERPYMSDDGGGAAAVDWVAGAPVVDGI
jgi:hypothetical protein